MPAGAAGAGEPRLLVSDAMDLPCPGTRPPAWVLRAAWGTQHPAQAELLLLLRLAGALGLRRSRTGSGGGILLLFEGPESGHVLEKPVWWRAETKARGMVCISHPPV